MTLLTIRSIINRICGLLMIIGLPCIIIWIILIVKNKSKKSKTWWIVLICLPILALIIQFVSNLVIHNLALKEYENNLPHQNIIMQENDLWWTNSNSQEWTDSGRSEWTNPRPNSQEWTDSGRSEWTNPRPR